MIVSDTEKFLDSVIVSVRVSVGLCLVPDRLKVNVVVFVNPTECENVIGRVGFEIVTNSVRVDLGVEDKDSVSLRVIVAVKVRTVDGDRDLESSSVNVTVPAVVFEADRAILVTDLVSDSSPVAVGLSDQVCELFGVIVNERFGENEDEPDSV